MVEGDLQEVRVLSKAELAGVRYQEMKLYAA